MTFCNCETGEGSCAEISDTSYPVARKTHTCAECRCLIGTGHKYQYIKALWDGQWGTVKTCMVCVKIRKDYFKKGCIHGELAENLKECLGVDLV